MRPGRLRRLVLGATCSLVVLVVVDQVLQHAVLARGGLLGRPVAPFDPPLFAPSQVEKLARIERALTTGDPDPRSLRFDAELGWCNPPGGGAGEFRYDWAGARIGVAPLASERMPDVRRLAVYGCSMTHGDEVAAAEAWPARLDALRDDLEVANMGVSAYGLDQALLRQRRDGPPLGADEVWLVWMPEATLRVTTLYRPLLRHWSLDVAFKPRLVLGPDGVLRLASNPARSLEDIPRLLSDQALLLARLGDDDHWVARAPLAYAPRGASWLHASGLARVALTLHEAGGRELGAHLADGHATRVLVEALVHAAAAEAARGGARFRLVLLPGPGDLAEARAGVRPWAAALASLRADGIEVSDATDTLLAASDPYAEHGHLDAGGSDVVARWMAAWPQDVAGAAAQARR